MVTCGGRREAELGQRVPQRVHQQVGEVGGARGAVGRRGAEAEVHVALGCQEPVVGHEPGPGPHLQHGGINYVCWSN